MASIYSIYIHDVCVYLALPLSLSLYVRMCMQMWAPLCAYPIMLIAYAVAVSSSCAGHEPQGFPRGFPTAWAPPYMKLAHGCAAPNKGSC